MDVPAETDDRKGLLSVMSSSRGAPLSRHDSLMENVRHRLETNTNVFLVPGLSDEARSLGRTSETKKHRLKPRRVCGREVSVSFRTLLLSAVTFVMVVTMCAQVITQVVYSRDISNSLIGSCNEATAALLNETSTLVLEGIDFIAQERLTDASVDLKLYLVSQAQGQVASLYNFILSSQAELPTNRTPVAVNATALFISRQVFSSFANWVDSMSIGYLDNAYFDAASCHDIVTPWDASLTDNIGACPRTSARTNGTSLIRCRTELRGTVIVSTNDCHVFENFLVDQQAPVVAQLAYGAKNLGVTVPKLIWSTPYQVNGFNFERDGRRRNTTAISLSYPLFSPGCQSYSCVTSFIWAPLTSRAFGGFCQSELDGSRNTSGNFYNRTALYVVDGNRNPFNGTLLGGSFAATEAEHATIVPETVYPATMSDIRQIADSARYLILQYGSFANPAFDSVVLRSYFSTNLSTCTVVSGGKFENLQVLQDCVVVAAISVYSQETEPLFETIERARFVLIMAVPLSSLTADFLNQYLESQQKATEQRQEQEAAITNLIGIGAGIAIASVVAGILLAWVIALRVSRPISKLDKTMQNLMSFNFKVKETDHLSRVSDISNAEKTMEALSDAIEVFAKFVPATVVKGIVQGRPESTRLHVEHRIVTVAFSDIKGFTSISEKLEISDLLFFLTRYLTVMTEIVELYDGTVTEILGDGLLILWNAPDDCSFHAAKACAAALAMQAAVKHVANEFKAILSPYGLDNLGVRVGIHTGRVLAGNIGSTTKLKYGCLGDTVNTASRLEGLCKLYDVGVICSRDSYDQLPSQKFQCRELDLVQVKGKDVALGLYEVQALRDKVVVPGDGQAELGSKQALNETGLFGFGKSSRAALRRLSTSVKLNLVRAPRQSTTTASNLGGTASQKDSGQSKGSVQSFGPIDTLQQAELQEKQVQLTEYERALHLFQSGNFEDALAVLSSISPDAASALLSERCRNAVIAVQRGEIDLDKWTGVNRLTEKY